MYSLPIYVAPNELGHLIRTAQGRDVLIHVGTFLAASGRYRMDVSAQSIPPLRDFLYAMGYFGGKTQAEADAMLASANQGVK